MKRSTFVRIATITIVFIFAVGSLFPIVAQVDPARDFLVYFVRGVERMPAGQPARVNDPAVQALFSRFNVSAASVTSGFPNFREADTLMTTAEGRLIGMPNMAKIFRIRAPGELQRNQLVNALKELPGVLFAEPDGLASVDVVPNDQYFSQQWSLQSGGGTGRIQAPEA